jgi:hypothetical protein
MCGVVSLRPGMRARCGVGFRVLAGRVRQVWSNCLRFNGEGSEMMAACDETRQALEQRWQAAGLLDAARSPALRRPPATAPPPPVEGDAAGRLAKGAAAQEGSRSRGRRSGRSEPGGPEPKGADGVLPLGPEPSAKAGARRARRPSDVRAEEERPAAPEGPPPSSAAATGGRRDRQPKGAAVGIARGSWAEAAAGASGAYRQRRHSNAATGDTAGSDSKSAAGRPGGQRKRLQSGAAPDGGGEAASGESRRGEKAERKQEPAAAAHVLKSRTRRASAEAPAEPSMRRGGTGGSKVCLSGKGIIGPPG